MTRRKSDADKRREGTFRTDRARDEPVPLEALLLPPANLSAGAQQVWRRREAGLRASGVLQECDAELFALWCVLSATLDECYTGGRMPPRDVMVNFRALSRELGIGAESRSKLGIKATEPQRKPRSIYDHL